MLWVISISPQHTLPLIGVLYKAYEEQIREQDKTGDNDQIKLLLSKVDGQSSNIG